MRKNLPFIREEVSAEEARVRIEAAGEPYKLEILESIVSRCVLVCGFWGLVDFPT